MIKSDMGLTFISVNSPITNTEPASFYLGIDTSISYGGFFGLFSQEILSRTAGIVDTGK